MSKILEIKIDNCNNYFTIEDLLVKSELTSTEKEICLRCENHLIEDDGTVVCKYKKI